jgi:hypothetical protein
VWGKIVDFVTGLFGGKGGTTQIGSRNTSTANSQSISGVTVGEGARDVIVTNTNNHYSSPPQGQLPPFEPTPEEAVIIRSLSQPGSQPLQRVRIDCQSQYILLINGREAANPFSDVEQCYRYLDALGRLQKYGLLADDSGDGTVFRLSPSGRSLALQLPASSG